MLSCPECDAVLDVAEAELEDGGTISCEECGANLVVVTTDPAIELRVEGGEDLEDDEEFEDELGDEESELDDEEEASEEDDEDWPH
jgi:alpha-aminoadipate carrier protein LysW